MIVYMRGAGAAVSNVKERGAMSTASVLRGAELAPALPKSEKSVSRTVTLSSGT